jgi:hypothetical protein
VTLVPLVVTWLCCSHWTHGSSCCTVYISLVALCWTLIEGSEDFCRNFYCIHRHSSVLSPKNGDCMEGDVGDVNQGGESVSDARDF